MEATLSRLNRHWNGTKYVLLHNRKLLDTLCKRKNLPHIQVLTGVRRSGKSTLFKLLINDLMDTGIDPKEILVLNLDEPLFISIWDNAPELYKIIEAAEKFTGVRIKYLFLDEVQQVKNWELFAKGAYDSQRFEKIYVTGSNSNLLQNQFAGMLSGRYFADKVTPFSLHELLQMNGFRDRLSATQRKSELLALVDRYLEWGGFPEIVLNQADNDTKTALLQNYYESIVLKDCIAYNKVREPELFNRLLYFVLSNVSSPFHYNSIAKAVKCNESTARSYLSYAMQAYILSEIADFSFSLKEDARPQRKFYCTDNGLINAIRMRFSPGMGMLLENVVFNELLNYGYELITFAKRHKECDFIARINNEYHAFQVCYEINGQNKDREIAGFNALGNDVTFSSKTILTYNQKEEVNDIRIAPVWEFFGIK